MRIHKRDRRKEDETREASVMVKRKQRVVMSMKTSYYSTSGALGRTGTILTLQSMRI